MLKQGFAKKRRSALKAAGGVPPPGLGGPPKHFRISPTAEWIEFDYEVPSLKARASRTSRPSFSAEHNDEEAECSKPWGSSAPDIELEGDYFLRQVSEGSEADSLPGVVPEELSDQEVEDPRRGRSPKHAGQRREAPVPLRMLALGVMGEARSCDRTGPAPAPAPAAPTCSGEARDAQDDDTFDLPRSAE